MEGQTSVLLDQDQDKTDQVEETNQAEARPWLRRYHFRKGQSGNPGGKPKNDRRKTVADWAQREITQKDADALEIPKILVGLTWGQAAVVVLATWDKRPRSPGKSDVQRAKKS